MALGPENARARHNQQARIETSSLGTDSAVRCESQSQLSMGAG